MRLAWILCFSLFLGACVVDATDQPDSDQTDQTQPADPNDPTNPTDPTDPRTPRTRRTRRTPRIHGEKARQPAEAEANVDMSFKPWPAHRLC